MSDAQKTAEKIYHSVQSDIAAIYKGLDSVDDEDIISDIEERDAAYRQAVDELVVAGKIIAKHYKGGWSINSFDVDRFSDAIAAVEKLQEAKDGKTT